jgi:hypothetical protein
MLYRFGKVRQGKKALHNQRGEIMKLNPLALLSVLICFLVAGPPVVSAANDGEVYVVALDGSGNSRNAESLGGGKFAELQFMGQVSGVGYGNGIGDFDNDGDLDYVTAAGYSSGSVYLFEKIEPDKGFAAPVVVGSWDGGDTPAGIAVADFNEDGNLDFILTLYPGIDCVLYTGNGQLGFSHEKIFDTAPNLSVGADAADFNNDGHADFVVAPFSYGHLQIFYVNLGRGDGTFETLELEFASYDFFSYWGVAAGDFDGDGIVDLVATRAGAIDLYLGVGDGTFDRGDPIEDPGVYSYSPVGNYDFDGDGVQDIVIGLYGTEYPQRYQDIGVLRGDGEGGFSYAGTIPGVSGSYPFTLTAPHPLADNISPVAVIDPAAQTITAGEAATFNADASFDEDGEIVSYTWSFGDQIPTLTRNASQGPSAQHVFYEAGLHTITLTVTDNMGATSSVEAQVRVDPLAVKVRLTPRVIKPGRGPRWVRATIWLPRGYDASKIDPGSVCIVENQKPLLYAHPQRASKKSYKYAKRRISRMYQVKFKRQALLIILDGAPGRKKLRVQGKLSHYRGSVSFEGVGNMRVIKPNKIIKPDIPEKEDKKDRLDKKRNKMQKLMKKLARIWSGWLKRHQ